MASAGRRGGGGDRILESRHVIGLFLLMLLFSGVFFTLGYVMGRNQYDGQVRAATNPRTMPDPTLSPRTDVVQRRPKNAPVADAAPDGTAPSSPEWEFYHAGEAKKTDDHLKPAAPEAKTVPAVAKSAAQPKPANASSRTRTAPLIPSGSFILQVAALTKEADALDLATRLQKKKFPAFVLSPQTDKYYHVQVGPYPDQKSADVAKKGLDDAGFKAIVKH